jgi:hypothetical protein
MPVVNEASSMSRNLKLMLVSVVAVAGLAALYLYSNPIKNRTTLRDLLVHPNCKQACWQGIEPAVMHKSELERYLRDNKTEFSVTKAGVEDIYTWKLPQDSLVGSEVLVTIYFTRDNKVEFLLIAGTDLCLSTVTNAYGIPSKVTGEPDYLELLYKDQPIVFHVGSDLVHVSAIRIIPSQNLQDFLENTFEKQWNDISESALSKCSDRFSP